MSVALASIRHCLDGAIPAAIATCSADGIPNVSYVSEVHYVDLRHVALSYQFFNKTRVNVLANPAARVLVIDPNSGTQYELDVAYERTETDGPIFQSMRVKLAGIAAHTGMSTVFRLRGSDVYEVLAVRPVAGSGPVALPQAPLPGLRRLSERLVGCGDLELLIDALLDGLAEALSIGHSMLFLHDEAAGRVYLIGSRGYDLTGIGSEIPLGHGIVGIAAAERAPIRITHHAEEFRYGETIRDGDATRIPLPGLAHPGSQLAIPIVAGARLLGVLYVESTQSGAFGYDSEDMLVTLANQFAASLYLLDDEQHATSAPAATLATGTATIPLRLRYFRSNCSVFVDDDYLIKGVAGAILWKLLGEFTQSGRSQFSNRELRLDPDIGLPDVCENLEARLVLLKRRLLEKCSDIRIVPVARGKFRLDVARPVILEIAEEAGRGRARP